MKSLCKQSGESILTVICPSKFSSHAILFVVSACASSIYLSHEWDMEGPEAGWVPQFGALPLLLSSVWEPDSWAASLYGPTCHGAGRLCCRTDQEPKERDEVLSPGSFQYKGLIL